MKLNATLLGAVFLASAVGATQARAEDPVTMGTFDDWEAYSYKSNGAPVCYIYSVPKKTESDKKINKRDPVSFLVTNFVGRKIKGQVSTIIGYPFKESSTVSLKIDDKDFELYTNGDTAWAAAVETEAQIVKSLKTGKSLTISGTSWKGTVTTDTYSLTGVSKALEKIDTACK
jgi:invasion protein IalB